VTQATGGVVSYYNSGNVAYKVHTFLTSGNLTVTESGVLDILAVAGGGAGHGYVGGGGGAGGLVYATGNVSLGNCVITIGAGGTGVATPNTQDAANSANGANTVVTGTGINILAIGGGGAGCYSDMPGSAGGSGGGAGGEQSGGGLGGAAVPGQGNRGGDSLVSRSGNPSSGAGGGGAGALGQNSRGAGNTTAGSGGQGRKEGIDFAIDGTGYWYAGGGGGGAYNAGTGIATGGNGGAGGGGGGGAFGSISTPGTGGIGRNSGGIGQSSDTAGRGGDGGANTGGGGGGVGHYSSATNGKAGSGGSGIVIFRYSFIPGPVGTTVSSSTVILNKFITNTGIIPITGTGGSNRYTYAISPNLPSGLTFNNSNGQVLGQPRIAVSNQTYTVTVNDGFTQDNASFVLTTTLGLTSNISASGGILGYYYSSARDTFYRTHTFAESGNLIISSGGNIVISAFGAGGGGGSTTSSAGGGGAFVRGEFEANARTYGVIVGSGGQMRGPSAGTGTAPTGGGGLPGNSGFGGQGGGYSGFFGNSIISQATAILIAGGGGGASWDGRSGGAGGILVGDPGQDGTTYGGRGGSQSSGGYSASTAGTALQGGNVGAQGDGGGGGGGGGGYFGGGGGTSDGTGSGGGGGSSFISSALIDVLAIPGSGSVSGGAGVSYDNGYGTGSAIYDGNRGAVVIAYPLAAGNITTIRAVPTVTLSKFIANPGVQPITASNGLPPYFYTISPDLPSGLYFETSTGKIQGQPTINTAATTYTITVKDETIEIVGAPTNVASNTFVLSTDITQPSVTVTGGNITYANANGFVYQIHSFTTSGNLTISRPYIFDYLVVAGGGGGGSDMGGGGGGGGYLAGTKFLDAGNYVITVGAGGGGAPAGTDQVRAGSGSDSALQTLTNGTNPNFYSYYFDQGSDVLSLASNAAFNIGSNDASVELWFWMYRSDGTYHTFNGQNSGTGSTIRIGFNTGNLYYSINNDTARGNFSVSIQTWYHVLVTYTGGTARFFVNGILRDVTSGLGTITARNETYFIGSEDNIWLNGFISNFRFCNGSIPTTYQTTFTIIGSQIFVPSTIPLTTTSQGANASHVAILTCQSSSIKDNSPNNFTITNNGNVTPYKFTPFETLVAVGGGGGASDHTGAGVDSSAASGGSGGGASGQHGNHAVGISGQGNQGSPSAGQWYPGGGGGAGGAGSTNPAHGGRGVLNDILGIPYYWAGGGGGSGYSGSGGDGGLGGGGGGAVNVTAGGAGFNPGQPGGGGSINSQTNTPGGNAGANTGGGGGGGSHYNFTNSGGSGGSGIVVIRFIIREPLQAQKVLSTVNLSKSPAQTFVPIVGRGGTAPYTYAISPTLPNGVTFDANTGTVAGSPTIQVIDQSYTVTVTDSSVTANTVSNTFLLTTALRHIFSFDIIADSSLLTLTSEFQVADSQRAPEILATKLEIRTNDFTKKTVLFNVVDSIPTLLPNQSFAPNNSLRLNSIDIDHSFEGNLSYGGNLQVVYGTIISNVGASGNNTTSINSNLQSISLKTVDTELFPVNNFMFFIKNTSANLNFSVPYGQTIVNIRDQYVKETGTISKPLEIKVLDMNKKLAVKENQAPKVEYIDEVTKDNDPRQTRPISLPNFTVGLTGQEGENQIQTWS